MMHAAEIAITNTAQSTEEELSKAVETHRQLLEAVRVKNAFAAQKIMTDLLTDSLRKLFGEELPEYISLFDTSTDRGSAGV